MATTFHFIVSLPADRPAQLSLASEVLHRAHDIVARLESELTEFRPESPVYRLNHAPIGERVALPASALELLDRAERARASTDGHFDCTAKSAAGARGGIAWDEHAAWRTHAATHLGFGAIGKGYALDRVRLLIEDAGFTDYLLSGGGSSVILSGFAAPGDPWSWGWSWKKDSAGEDLGQSFTHASGRAIALGISGTHERGEHILRSDATGTSPLSSLVAASSATEADAWSTALFLAEFEEGLTLMDRAFGGGAMPEAARAVARIESDGTPRWNGTFQHLWGTPA